MNLLEVGTAADKSHTVPLSARAFSQRLGHVAEGSPDKLFRKLFNRAESYVRDQRAFQSTGIDAESILRLLYVSSTFAGSS